eukprot:TRINITY_DN4530_c0_g1_i1.p1 TRINITY_DN4530_c0_g1~~TRINITY_DN4530_c0_g1_i1.p1  ORF type:complete len:754 (+),score=251.08 TRINITY_DN4530_c0_g1_i1:295-2262(+)
MSQIRAKLAAQSRNPTPNGKSTSSPNLNGNQPSDIYGEIGRAALLKNGTPPPATTVRQSTSSFVVPQASSTYADMNKVKELYIQQQKEQASTPTTESESRGRADTEYTMIPGTKGSQISGIPPPARSKSPSNNRGSEYAEMPIPKQRASLSPRTGAAMANEIAAGNNERRASQSFVSPNSHGSQSQSTSFYNPTSRSTEGNSPRDVQLENLRSSVFDTTTAVPRDTLSRSDGSAQSNIGSRPTLSSPPAIQAGWVRKKGPKKGDSWKKRWIEFREAEGKLHYMNGPKSKPNGTVDFSEVSAIRKSSDSRHEERWVFNIETEKRPFIFATATEDEMNRWLDVLNKYMEAAWWRTSRGSLPVIDTGNARATMSKKTQDPKANLAAIKDATAPVVELRLAVIGDSNIGKTSLISRWRERRFVEEEQTPENQTIPDPVTGSVTEPNPVLFSINDQRYHIFFVDYSHWCSAEFQGNRDENPFQDIDGIFMCYDISKMESYMSLDKKWKSYLEKYKILEQMSIVITATRGDIKPHAIDTSLIKMTKKYADDDIITSAKEGTNIDEAIATMLMAYLNNPNQNQKTAGKQQSKAWEVLVGNSRDVGDSPHQFQEFYFPRPTWCDFCDLFIWGVSSAQGYRCNACKYSAHKKCYPLVPCMCRLE